jgi:MoaA/NifB/PqqE/SkfB family radical SAM enzyme
MQLNKAATLARRLRRRVAGLPLHRQAYYVLNTIVGETLRTRSIGTLGLRLVGIDLTDRCQCRCVHCYAVKSSSKGDELATTEVQSVLDQAAAMHATEVSFSGGEPLLHADLVGLVQYAHRKGLVTKINTNGVLLSEPLIRELKEAGLNWCAVSLDSAHRDEHDRLRRYPGCYDSALNGLRTLVQYDIACSITTYVNRRDVNTERTHEIVALGRALGVDAVRVNFAVPMGRFADRQDLVLTPKEREQVRELLKDEIVSMESPRESTKCTAGVTTLNVMANGDVTPCVFVPLPYGNIRKQSLRAIWRAMAEFDRMCKPTGQCPMGNLAFRKRLNGLRTSSQRPSSLGTALQRR